MKITSDNFKQGDFIPEALAWGRIGEDGSTVRSTNLNPQLSWTDAPEGTASFVLACLDDDVPTDLAERDASGEIPVSQPRRRFVHWVQPNCPADMTSIAEGALAEERKTTPGFGAVCINDYSRGGTPAPGETGTGYDGPCPPFFDARWHYYRFMVFALDAPRLELPENATWQDVDAAMKGHVLASAELVGRYTLNPRLAAL